MKTKFLVALLVIGLISPAYAVENKGARVVFTGFGALLGALAGGVAGGAIGNALVPTEECEGEDDHDCNINEGFAIAAAGGIGAIVGGIGVGLLFNRLVRPKKSKVEILPYYTQNKSTGTSVGGTLKLNF